MSRIPLGSPSRPSPITPGSGKCGDPVQVVWWRRPLAGPKARQPRELTGRPAVSHRRDESVRRCRACHRSGGRLTSKPGPDPADVLDRAPRRPAAERRGVCAHRPRLPRRGPRNSSYDDTRERRACEERGGASSRDLRRRCFARGPRARHPGNARSCSSGRRTSHQCRTGGCRSHSGGRRPASGLPRGSDEHRRASGWSRSRHARGLRRDAGGRRGRRLAHLAHPKCSAAIASYPGLTSSAGSIADSTTATVPWARTSVDLGPLRHQMLTGSTSRRVARRLAHCLPTYP